MKAAYTAIFIYCVSSLTAADDATGREIQPRGLVHRSQLNAVVRPTAEDRRQPEVIDPQIVVDQNITFHDIGCVVGRACSRIIQPNLPKSPKPTFKPYVKNEQNHFKGTLSMLYPPRINGSNEVVVAKKTQTPSSTTATSTFAPSTTPKNVWVVRPQKKTPLSSKEEKKTAVIDNIINILKEISSNSKPNQLNEAHYSEKYQNKVVTKYQVVSTTPQPAVHHTEKHQTKLVTKFQPVTNTDSPKGVESTREHVSGVAVYRKPPNNLSYTTKSSVKEDSNKVKRPVLFSNNQPIYDKGITTTTFRPFTTSTIVDSQYSWFESLIQASKKNMLEKQQYPANVAPVTNIKEQKLSESKIESPSFITWTAMPVSSYYDPPVQKELKNQFTKEQKNQQKIKHENSKIRPYIVTAEELRKKREEEEERLRLERLKKQAQTLKPFVVSASFGFDNKRGRSLDLNNSLSEKLVVLPSRGRSVIRNIEGHKVETSVDATNLTELIMRDRPLAARSMRLTQGIERGPRYFARYENPSSGLINQENLTALILNQELPKPAERSRPEFFSRYYTSGNASAYNPKYSSDGLAGPLNLTALIFSHDIQNERTNRKNEGYKESHPGLTSNVHIISNTHSIRQAPSPSLGYHQYHTFQRRKDGDTVVQS